VSGLLSGTNPKPVRFTWVDLSTISPRPSLGASFRLNNTDVLYTNRTANPSAKYTLNEASFACSIDARWAPVEPFMSSVSNTVVASDYMSELKVEKAIDFRQIRIDPS
jgi:hypothetical protein